MTTETNGSRLPISAAHHLTSLLDPQLVWTPMHRAEQIDARLARYASTLDARDLWPDVSVAAFHSAQAEIARGTAAVLEGAPRPSELQRPRDTDARALGVAAS